MALMERDLPTDWTSLPATRNPWADADRAIDQFAAFRSAIDESRHNGWRETDRVGDEMERYLATVRSSLRPAPVTAPARWLPRH